MFLCPWAPAAVAPWGEGYDIGRTTHPELLSWHQEFGEASCQRSAGSVKIQSVKAVLKVKKAQDYWDTLKTLSKSYNGLPLYFHPLYPTSIAINQKNKTKKVPEPRTAYRLPKSRHLADLACGSYNFVNYRKWQHSNALTWHITWHNQLYSI